ncbi:MAG: response regulator [Chloroflexi bacterium]|nr:response regulator [Chloroflexota bacterium]
MTDSRMAVDAHSGVKEEVLDLRRGTLMGFLSLTLLVLLLWLLRVVGRDYSMGPPDLAALVLLVSAPLALFVRERSPAAASWTFMASITVAQCLMLAAYPRSLLPRALGVLVVILGNATLNTGQGLLAAAVNWLSLAATLQFTLGDAWLAGHSLEILALNLLSWVASYLGGRPLATTTTWALEAWERARDLLAETQNRRGELYGALRSIEEATYRIERMNNELLLAQQQAEEARAVKARLVAMVSHELRNPLNLVLGFSELMALHPEKYGEPLPSAYYADVDVIYRNTRHLLALIDDILDLSRIEAQRLPLVKSLIDLEQDVVRRVGETLRPLCERKGLIYREVLAGDLPPVLADPVRLCQVLSNLVTNAVRYTEHGSVTVRTALSDGELIVSVEDTGPGIPGEDIPKLFREFNRLVRTDTREASGTGLGLSISKQLVELHGGRVWVESKVGVGTAVHCAMPVSEEAATPHGMPGAQPRRRTVPHTTCLIVHQDPALVRLLGRYVEGYRMVGVTGQDDVLAATEQLHPRAIITSAALARSVRHTLAGTPFRVPVIALNVPRRAGRLAAQGIIGYLTKPITVQTLQPLMKQFAHLEQTTILIVDDDPDFVRLLENLLELLPHPYRFARAYNGRQALERMEAVTPDVVFLDLVMPELGGEQVVACMRRHERLKGVPVVIVSAMDVADEGIAVTSPVSVHLGGDLDGASAARLLGAVLNELRPSYLCPEPAT